MSSMEKKYSFFKELSDFWGLLGFMQRASLIFLSLSFFYIVVSS